jgi:hypothetical protein
VRRYCLLVLRKRVRESSVQIVEREREVEVGITIAWVVCRV